MVAGLDSRHAGTNCFDNSGALVAEDHGSGQHDRTCLNRQITVADTGRMYPHTNFTGTGVRQLECPQYEVAARRFENRRPYLHGHLPLV
jgi:hypothetical protein